MLTEEDEEVRLFLINVKRQFIICSHFFSPNIIYIFIGSGKFASHLLTSRLIYYKIFLSFIFFPPFRQASFYSTALKTLISVSTVILLGLIVAYHALEVQVSESEINDFYVKIF